MEINYHSNSFTAADIEKYHKGLLSAKEMYDLEKAALDDPFLAEALEGYAVAGVNATDDIATLKQQLKERTERKTVVAPITPGNRSSNLWLKIAAIIILVAGGGLLVYQLGSNDKKDTVAQADSSVKKENEPAIPIAADNKTDTIAGTAEVANQSLSAPGAQENRSLSEDVITDKKTAFSDNATDKKQDDADFKKTPLSTTETYINRDNNPEKALAGKVNGITAAKSKKEETEKPIEAADTVEYLIKKIPGIVVSPSSQNHQKAKRNIFRGIITDEQNNPLPFANITNIADNVGTYADVKGNFVLTSPDSVLNVQVRSVGFANNSYSLRYDPSPNRIVMSEDRSLSEVVISRNGRSADSIRSRNNSMVLEEPEPVDGWYNYDTYLANNLNVPESYRSSRQSDTGGKVEVSFEVDDWGEPINIRIEKSLCEACDKEAIRLIKDGPKFKRKAAKNGRTTVSVFF